MRKRAALWLLAILLQPLVYGTYVIKGFPWDLHGAIHWDTLLNHRLINLESAFCALALFCAIFLLLRPTWRPLWRCSIYLMTCAALTNLANHMHLRGGVMPGLKSFVGSGSVASFVSEDSHSLDRLFDNLPEGSTGLGHVISFFRNHSAYASHNGTVVLVIVWIAGVSALLTILGVKGVLWLRAKGGQTDQHL